MAARGDDPGTVTQCSGEDATTRHFDVVVVGAGVAGLSAALALAPLRVALVTKAATGRGGSSRWAQGGIAAAVGPDDAPSLHAADTLSAADGLAVRDTVDILVREGPEAVARLLDIGVRFDRDGDGELALGREAAHARRRILHANGDGTGAEVVRALGRRVSSTPDITVFERAFVSDLVVAEEPRRSVRGVTATTESDAGRTAITLLAPAVVLATGGCGQLYASTTNPCEATADGLAMALRAGARVVDVEFVQFHPTALAVESDPRPLLTEALRGEGAVLIDETGARFMSSIHPDAELAPRDVVARSIWQHLDAGHTVSLDATRAVGDAFPTRFPTVWTLCRAADLDPRRTPLPVTPAAHYHMGGVATDAVGRTSIAGLWACGEVASTGVHGANRLASNSLLEGLVFGARVGRDIGRWLESSDDAARRDAHRQPQRVRYSDADPELEQALRSELREIMWTHVGLVRCETSLTRAFELLDGIGERCPSDAGELANMVLAAKAIAWAARARRESRGGHWRSDVPHHVARFAQRSAFALGDEGSLDWTRSDRGAARCSADRPQRPAPSPRAPASTP